MFHNSSPPQDFMKIILITSVIRWLMKNIKVAESYPEEKLHTLFSRRIVFHFCSLALQEDLDQHFSFCQPVSLSLRCDSTMESNSLWDKKWEFIPPKISYNFFFSLQLNAEVHYEKKLTKNI